MSFMVQPSIFTDPTYHSLLVSSIVLWLIQASFNLTSCHLGKSKKLPFSDSTSVTSRPLELIHSDVWGPVPTSSISGFKYYFIFINDYSCYCWLFPLWYRSVVYHTFVTFKSHVENLLINALKLFVQMEVESSQVPNFAHSLHIMVLFINYLALTLLNKMALLKESTVLYLKLV